MVDFGTALRPLAQRTCSTRALHCTRHFATACRHFVLGTWNPASPSANTWTGTAELPRATTTRDNLFGIHAPTPRTISLDLRSPLAPTPNDGTAPHRTAPQTRARNARAVLPSIKPHTCTHACAWTHAHIPRRPQARPPSSLRMHQATRQARSSLLWASSHRKPSSPRRRCSPRSCPRIQR
ncbi:hypothetical protein PLESTF_000423300 [Pleodorina starrii]|nr:hypothetical protein PLESTF_000423300 [Pleodorina starrii]